MSDPLDPHDLQRFLSAQDGVFDKALAELQAGHKTSHWMWFIFPQLAGLGRSQIAQFYALNDADEARAYLAHPVLGPRLQTCATALLRWDGRSATDILGSPDDLKLRSSMTLFAAVAPDNPVFARVLEVFFKGKGDTRTLNMLGMAH
ncbi:DUF1810 domain-containing protein [Pseudomonas sp.]|uniref:DUF1810 domain-containing protein n=1 Tax=Pseudomonas sp. TaxID=306 RepID=UPI00272C3556|nr:DUF1810 domain-containing protein [Pseudomonas sp.]